MMGKTSSATTRQRQNRLSRPSGDSACFSIFCRLFSALSGSKNIPKTAIFSPFVKIAKQLFFSCLIW
jgi:hypothetical protein